MKTRIVMQLLGVAFLASGCSHAQQQQQTAIRETAVQAQERCNAAFADPAITPVLDKVAINVRDTTFEMRTNQQHASQSEKVALEAWMHARNECWNAAAAMRSGTQPQIAAVQSVVWQKTDSLIARLYAGQISYGEFNNGRIENVQEEAKEIANIRQNLAAQRAQIQAIQKANGAQPVAPVAPYRPSDDIPTPSTTFCYHAPMIGVTTCQTN